MKKLEKHLEERNLTLKGHQWITTGGFNPSTIGIIRVSDKYKDVDTILIGVGMGYSEEQDLIHIIDWGRKMDMDSFGYDSLIQLIK